MYNYVIFGSDSDLYKTSYSDVIEMDNVRYVSTPTQYRNAFFSLLYRMHWSPRINKIIKLPFKSIWNNGYFVDNFINKKHICFIFFGAWLGNEKNSIVRYIKREYKNSRVVCFFQDLIDVRSDVNICEIKSLFDLIISFDQAESKKYDIEYHHLVFSRCLVDSNNSVYESDVYFLGKVKNRLDDIISVYEYLISKKLKCKFFLVGVDKSKQVYSDQICYIDKMSYADNLKHVISTRCLLEIMQKNGQGYTQRMCEAIAYNKIILTNNSEVKYAPFYNEKYISIFNDSSSIDIGFLRSSPVGAVNYEYKDNLSPKKLLIFIEEKLNSK